MTHEEFDQVWAAALRNNPQNVDLMANEACSQMEYQFDATLWQQLAALYPEVTA